MPLVSKNFSDIITFTRASTATYFNSSGVLTSAAINEARFDYNPSTLAAQGFLVEEQRTNSIRNNTMQGAVDGTPGTLPTNWGVAGGGLTANVIGTGTESGITYIDIQLVGTTSSTSAGIRFEPTNFIAASSGQTWTGSFYVRQVGGTLTNINSVRANIFGRTSANASNTDSFQSASFSASLSATNIATNRQSVSGTLADATTAFIGFQLAFGFASGVAIDITLRIGLPQLEQGAFATSAIPTTTTALTRSADVASVNTLSPWYNATAGTLYVEIVRQTTTGFPGRARFSDGTANNSIDLYYDAASNSSTFEIKSGGSSSVQIYGGGGALNTVVKAAAAWETNNAAVVYDTVVQGTDTSVVVPSGINQLRLANALTGYIRRITYYPRRLTNAQLQAITA